MDERYSIQLRFSYRRLLFARQVHISQERATTLTE